MLLRVCVVIIVSVAALGCGRDTIQPNHESRFIKFSSSGHNFLAVEESYPKTGLRIMANDKVTIMWNSAYAVQIEGDAQFKVAGKLLELNDDVLTCYELNGEVTYGPAETVFVYKDGQFEVALPMK